MHQCTQLSRPVVSSLHDAHNEINNRRNCLLWLWMNYGRKAPESTSSVSIHWHSAHRTPQLMIIVHKRTAATTPPINRRVSKHEKMNAKPTQKFSRVLCPSGARFNVFVFFLCFCLNVLLDGAKADNNSGRRQRTTVVKTYRWEWSPLLMLYLKARRRQRRQQHRVRKRQESGSGINNNNNNKNEEN